MLHFLTFYHEDHSGAHTIGSKDDTNILISFASFENDGSAKKFASMPRSDGSVLPLVVPSDRQQHRQYENCDTKVYFHSLQDFSEKRDVKDFLEPLKTILIEEVRQNNATKTSEAKAKARTNLFLQDFPSEGK